MLFCRTSLPHANESSPNSLPAPVVQGEAGDWLPSPARSMALARGVSRRMDMRGQPIALRCGFAYAANGFLASIRSSSSESSVGAAMSSCVSSPEPSCTSVVGRLGAAGLVGGGGAILCRLVAAEDFTPPDAGYFCFGASSIHICSGEGTSAVDDGDVWAGVPRPSACRSVLVSVAGEAGGTCFTWLDILSSTAI